MESGGKHTPEKTEKQRTSALAAFYSHANQDYLTEGVQESDPAVLFLNIIVVSINSGFADKVTSKITEKDPTKITNTLGSAISGGLEKILTKDTAATAVASDLPKKLPPKLERKGIAAKVAKTYQYGSFVVLRLDVHSVDFAELTGVHKGFMQSMCGWCPAACGHHTHNLGRGFILSKLIEKLPKQLEEEIAHKGIQATVVAKSEKEQEEYFEHFKLQAGIDRKKKCGCC